LTRDPHDEPEHVTVHLGDPVARDLVVRDDQDGLDVALRLGLVKAGGLLRFAFGQSRREAIQQEPIVA
jgi:hypothetical protein